MSQSSLHELDGGSAARTLTSSQYTTRFSPPFDVHEHVARLRQIVSTISVSVMALHHQGAERDHDIACVLDQQAGGPLEDEIEQLQLMLALRPQDSRQWETRA